MKQIELQHSDKFALISEVDYEKATLHKWYLLSVNGTSYVVTSIKGSDGAWTNEYLHRFILNASKDVIVQHQDENTLNNTRKNLKAVSRRESQAGYEAIKENAASPYRGVTINRNGKKKWRAQISDGGKAHYIGSFLTEKEAAEAYDEEATRRFGSTALLNFPEAIAEKP